MAEITNYDTTMSIKSLMANIQTYRYNPGAIQLSILDYLKNVTNGSVDIVDPTNPFVFLLEASSTNTAAAIIENENLLRLQYPSLAIDETELYIHMSDKDILNRFSRPAMAYFDVVIMKSDLLAKMIDSPSENCRKIVIPRNTQVKVGDYYFSIEYPIEIKQMYHGGIYITFDVSLESKIYKVPNVLINYAVTRDDSLTEWIVFKLPMYQFKVDSYPAAITNSTYFEYEVVYQDQFYTARVFYVLGGVEYEMRVSLTDQVYDPKVPTAILKVTEGMVTVIIPRVYINSGVVTGAVRIDVYTTKGNIAVNLANYKLLSFQTNMLAFNKDRDLSVYTNAASQTIILFSCADYINAGDNQLSFTELKTRLINNSLAGANLPITNNQLQGYLLDNGFELGRNTDVITNRIFIAGRRLDLPIDNHLYVPLDASIITLHTNNELLRNSDRIIENVQSITIRSNSLYAFNNGILRLLHSEETKAIGNLPKNDIATKLNTNEYYYSPFYYVLDYTSDEFKVRAYHLDDPFTKGISVKGINTKAAAIVNTSNSKIIKVENGYKLYVQTVSNDIYKKISNDRKQVYLSVTGAGEYDLAYIPYTDYIVTDTDEYIFEFDIISNHWIDDTGAIRIENMTMYNQYNVPVMVSLTSSFNLAYATSDYDVLYVDTNLQRFHPEYLSDRSEMVLMVENLDILLGYSLDYLWKQARSIYTDPLYLTYDKDVFMTYPDNVFKKDPITGSIFTIGNDCKPKYEILHYKGDPVVDTEGNLVIKHRRGDIVLDPDGNPKTVGDTHIFRLIDLFLLDAKSYFANDVKTTTYINEIKQSVVEWVTESLVTFNKKVLEQTKMYYKPKMTTGYINVIDDTGTKVSVNSAQQLTISVYVKESVYNNPGLRDNISLTIIKTIADMMNNTSVSTGIIINAIMNLVGDSVNSVSINGLGGKDYQTLTVVDDMCGLSIAKKLYLKSDGYLMVLEDITINYYNVLPNV